MDTIRRRTLLCTLMPFAAAAQMLVAPPSHADAALDSFARLLAHPATPMSTARPSEAADPLRAAIVDALRNGTAPAVAATDPRRGASGDDAIVGAFARMLDHEPTPLHAAVPSGTDPLVAALIEPLRDGHRVADRGAYAAARAAAGR